ncbi:MAG: 5-oxoprolinase subunit PxpB [Aquabacterium sp.]
MPPQPDDAPPVPRWLPMGDAAGIVAFGDSIAPQVHERVMGFAAALQAERAAGRLPAVAEWVVAYTTVTVHLDPRHPQADPDALCGPLLDLARAAPPLRQPGRRWRLPVCFDTDLAPDLADLATARGLSAPAVVDLLCGTPFRVYMIGFQPGFAYMGGLPAALELPRRASPRKAVPAGSLAVAGRMCGVYPWVSPGGWHLVGHCPVPMFDAADAHEPALLASGDEVWWQAVDRPAHAALLRDVEAGRVDRQRWRWPEGQPT